MAYTIPRPKLNFWEKIYLPTVLAGLRITLGHLVRMLLGRFSGKPRIIMQYPEEKWDAQLPAHYRGAPTLVYDEHGRIRCVSCQLCEFICPPRAIRIQPGGLAADDKFAKVEKYPEAFQIDMLRCIYCGLCEEVCPEQAIFLKKVYALTGTSRAAMVHDKPTLVQMGGLQPNLVHKWNEKK